MVAYPSIVGVVSLLVIVPSHGKSLKPQSLKMKASEAVDMFATSALRHSSKMIETSEMATV